MIEKVSDLPDSVAGFVAKGKVTAKDYESILIPEVEEKFKRHAKISLFYHLGSEFQGMEPQAMWDDAKIGFKHLTAWQKIAVVSDVKWVRTVMKTFGFVVPGRVQVFSNSHLDEARQWVCA